MVRRREDEVLEIIKSDPLISQKEIAERLGITRSSVGVHVNNLTKTGKLLGRGYVLPNVDSICIIGASNIDIYGHTSGALEKGDANYGKIELSVGGMSRNIANNACKLGLNINLITAISNDEYGKVIQDSCLKEGMRIDKSCIFSNRPSSFYMGLMNDKGKLEYGVSDMSIIEEISPSFINKKKSDILNSKLLLIDLNLPEKTVEFILKNFKEKNIVVIPVSASKSYKVKGLLQYVKLLHASIEELEVISDHKINNKEDLKFAASKLLEQGLSELIVSVNSSSIYYFSKDSFEELVIKTDNLVNDQGIMEAQAAGLIYAKYKGLGLVNSLKLALAAGAIAGESNQVVSPWLSIESMHEKAKL